MEKIKIALLLDEKGEAGGIPPSFAEAEYMLIMEAPEGKILSCEARQGREDEKLALAIVQADCECVLSGPIKEKPFLVLADDGGVTRYQAAGLGLAEALERFNGNQLELIRDYIGGKGCSSTGAGQCHEHD